MPEQYLTQRQAEALADLLQQSDNPKLIERMVTDSALYALFATMQREVQHHAEQLAQTSHKPDDLPDHRPENTPNAQPVSQSIDTALADSAAEQSDNTSQQNANIDTTVTEDDINISSADQDDTLQDTPQLTLESTSQDPPDDITAASVASATTTDSACPQPEPIQHVDSTTTQQAHTNRASLEEVTPAPLTPEQSQPETLNKVKNKRRTLAIHLPNGMCQRHYQQSLGIDNLHVQFCQIPDPLALTFSQETGQLSGTPVLAGEFDLKFSGYIQQQDSAVAGPREPVIVEARLTVNPDPRSLWQDLPSDANALFHKADLDSHCFDVNGKRLLAASRRGRSHAHKGTHRDDEAQVKHLQSDWMILAVADGAGSCPFSRRGSQLAIEVATEYLTNKLNGDAGNALVDACLAEADPSSSFNNDTARALHQTLISAGWQAATAIRAEADQHQLNNKDFSTTILLLITKETEQGHLVATFSIGDGAIVAYHQDRGVSLLCTPDSGEFAGQTRFLDSGLFQNSDIYQRIKIALIPDFTALIAMTDGITDAKFDTEAMLSQSQPWHDLWGELSLQLKGSPEQAQTATLEWLNFFVPGNHDDRSLAIVMGDVQHD